MAVLVTGGTGYIGAHVTQLLLAQGSEVVVVDDVATGVPERIAGVPLTRLELSDPGCVEPLTELLRSAGVTDVLHFAGRKQVGESVERPAWYYQQNIGGLANLAIAMAAADVRNLVFSSTAAVYGEPDSDRIDEHAPTEPVNPYGESKLFGERMLDRAATASGLRAVSLRYFNVAGAMTPELGDQAALNLLPMVFERLDAELAPLIFGDQYPTRDGTCVRDFIHVTDLAEAHLAVMGWLRDQRPGRHHRFNVGTGEGTSVREMVELIRDVAGTPLEAEVREPRPGDPASVVATPHLIQQEVGWRAAQGPREIVTSAWESHQHFHPAGTQT